MKKAKWFFSVSSRISERFCFEAYNRGIPILTLEPIQLSMDHDTMVLINIYIKIQLVFQII